MTWPQRVITPPIDILTSVSRLINNITDNHHQQLATRFREAVATYRNARDLVDIGAYVAGSNPQIDRALSLKPQIDAFLRQTPGEHSSWADTLTWLERIFSNQGGDPIAALKI